MDIRTEIKKLGAVLGKDDDKGKFKVIKVTKLADLENEKVKELPESDITIQTDTAIVQGEYIENEEAEKKKYLVKPGVFSIEDTAMGTLLTKFSLRDYELLESIDNTSTIMDESNKFFNKLGIYKTLGRDPKRAILLCSPPGVGKTASINKVCKELLKKEGTCVVVWDTAAIRASSVNRFFLYGCRFGSKVKQLIFIIEDISGGTTEDEYGSKGVNSSLLNLLDGVGHPFKGVPTFIISTTNNPEREVGALIDRPGRFDKVIELKTPTEKECRDLLKFIAKKKELSEDDVEAAKIASKAKFSIAHLQEMVVRSLLDDISILEAARQLADHKERFKKAFMEEKSIGMGLHGG